MMYRVQQILLLITLSGAAVVLSNCAATTPVWSFYDACSQQSSSFVAMAECGREKRLAYCEPKKECSAAGNAFMQYADALVLSVKNKEMTEAEAQRRFAEYKTQVLGSARRDAAIIAAGAAASGPRTCTAVGNTVNCF